MALVSTVAVNDLVPILMLTICVELPDGSLDRENLRERPRLYEINLKKITNYYTNRDP